MALNVNEALTILLVLINAVKGQTTPSSGGKETNESQCQELAQEPFFEPEMVSGKPWRTYYTWNMRLDNRCMDMNFKIATPAIIRRVYYDMNEYMEEQPAWGGASLLVTMGRARRELLLFDTQGPAGRLLGVPNVVRDGNMAPSKSTVPLLKFQMKLINNGKFLVILDCAIGVASLSSRFDEPPYRSEVDSAASSLKNILGEGNHACVQDNNENEKLPLE